MNRNIKIVVIGGSAGSFDVVKKILCSVPKEFSLPVVLCLHRLRDVRNGFVESLNIDSKISVKEPLDKEQIKPGFVYLSPSNYHLLIEPGRYFALSTEAERNYSRPSLDITFESAGYSFRENMAGIILSGANTDGAKGLFSAFQDGAFSIIQDPQNAQFSIMPGEVLKYFKPHKVLTCEEIIDFFDSLKYNKYV
ncbi:MAG TPA: chemotaxis protein CheB [Bacteroidales bacterium]|nr:chemotaxis protein CheB [Bacteroidales bacterium]